MLFVPSSLMFHFSSLPCSKLDIPLGKLGPFTERLRQDHHCRTHFGVACLPDCVGRCSAPPLTIHQNEGGSHTVRPSLVMNPSNIFVLAASCVSCSCSHFCLASFATRAFSSSRSFLGVGRQQRMTREPSHSAHKPPRLSSSSTMHSQDESHFDMNY